MKLNAEVPWKLSKARTQYGELGQGAIVPRFYISVGGPKHPPSSGKA